jgi:2-polyprenyl-6-methoxyphenol hydroxylase-like FAD-dependent oxidoreductase
MDSSMYDIAVIGGGPAGSTAAALLARAGRRVIVFEREKFPRFHIGESLLPFSMKAFTRLGLHEKFLRAGFIKKFGGEIFLAIACFCVTNCTTISSHEFSKLTSDWQTKTGQLMYRTPKTTLIGEALVRFSKAGDFELTVSKGPGITLLSLQQDASFAEVKGAFARQGWSGPIAQAPPQLRGWLGLRDQFIRAPNQKNVRYAVGNETFLFRF